MQQSANLFKANVKPPSHTRGLRSSDQNVLFVSRIKTKKGERSFSVAASKTVQSVRKKEKLVF